MLLNLGLSGISMVGDDIGGFNGSPAPDLLTRWIEIGPSIPLPRPHHARLAAPGSLGPRPGAGSHPPHYIETRYRLMPYITRWPKRPPAPACPWCARLP